MKRSIFVALMLVLSLACIGCGNMTDGGSDAQSTDSDFQFGTQSKFSSTTVSSTVQSEDVPSDDVPSEDVTSDDISSKDVSSVDSTVNSEAVSDVSSKQTSVTSSKEETVSSVESDTVTQSKTVYTTPTGKRYHLDPECGGKNASATTLDDAIGLGLTPCKKCAE